MRANVGRAWLVLVAVSLSASPGSAQSGDAAPFRLVPPARTASPPPPPKPTLPPRVTSVPPVTVVIAVQPSRADERQSVQRRTFYRATDRVRVVDSGKTEWYFVRNPVDHARVSAYRVDHDSRSIVIYDESDARNLLGVAGWAGVVSLGFDPSVLDSARATGDTRRFGSATFERFASGNTSFWWSADMALATDFRQEGPSGTVSLSVVSVTAAIDDADLVDPLARYPSYRVSDVAEWLESPRAVGR